jgi:2-polyprenyl-3-methyl-5-hydroxy-6-metoxy-1,4-benzoquinol methylase
MDASRASRAHAYENPRPEVQALVPADARRILDLGCASGALGAALKARQGCEVVGVELDPAYAQDARARLDRVVEGDVEQADLAELGRFDCVVCADVLEHLVDPWGLAARAVAVLEPGGTLVVSLPNVRFWETFWQIGVRGTWPRRSVGIFDRTHLRWFTLRDAVGLLADAGLTVEEVRRVGRVRVEGMPDSRLARALGRTPARTLFTFQHILRGRLPA